jgi:hypothetical protein
MNAIGLLLYIGQSVGSIGLVGRQRLSSWIKVFPIALELGIGQYLQQPFLVFRTTYPVRQKRFNFLLSSSMPGMILLLLLLLHHTMSYIFIIIMLQHYYYIIFYYNTYYR